MTYPSKVTHGVTTARSLPTAAANRIAQHSPLHSPQPRPRSLMRKYMVSSLGADGAPRNSEHIAPASLPFESAFAAFARGTMIATLQGPRSIEDIAPGTMLITRDGPPQPVAWVGSMTLVPSAPVENPFQLRLARIMADSFGLSRPAPDLLLGHGARLLQSPAALREIALQNDLLTPARAFIDGSGVIEITPPAPVLLYHLCLPQHAVIRAAGLEVETYHPGTSLLRDMAQNTRTLFLSLFPHITAADDFGSLAYPRAGQSTLERLHLA
ncbi:Hint domain-containing protein [Aquicoccus sp. G2-2]|uniref:Hint domain-containing protein n=1 Tax=Aquicoccus sp. G2-2 TaxID=3092120 RepID=UPI002AE0376E|nr:Hint domain-containing protein [Aquicoccus sp. G2-2]MEA1112154.1 Hint domain-containing protein [Aquicoccus sp. G2-2]